MGIWSTRVSVINWRPSGIRKTIGNVVVINHQKWIIAIIFIHQMRNTNDPWFCFCTAHQWLFWRRCLCAGGGMYAVGGMGLIRYVSSASARCIFGQMRFGRWRRRRPRVDYIWGMPKNKPILLRGRTGGAGGSGIGYWPGGNRLLRVPLLLCNDSEH